MLTTPPLNPTIRNCIKVNSSTGDSLRQPMKLPRKILPPLIQMIQTLAFPSVRSEVEALNWILLNYRQLERYCVVCLHWRRDYQWKRVFTNRLTNVPETALVWTTYEIQSGDLEGLGFGAGLFFVGEREGDQENSFLSFSFVRTDAAIYYRRNNWRALNFKRCWHPTSAGFRASVYPGEPLLSSAQYR